MNNKKIITQLFVLSWFLIVVLVNPTGAYEDVGGFVEDNNVSYLPSINTVHQIGHSMYSNMSIGFYPLVDVIDGDTISVKVDGEVKYVRLIGINTPELPNEYNEKGECFAEEAKGYLENMLSGYDSVILIKDSSQGDVDKYGRLLRYVFLTNFKNVNLYMIFDGYAYEYTYYKNKKAYIFQRYFRMAEDIARYLGRGLWSQCNCSNANSCS